jgi:uncharacterized protein with HEPN domain
MTNDRTIWRLRDMKQCIRQNRSLLEEKTFEQVQGELVTRAAFERFLEILSEASRHLPDSWKDEHSAVPWRQVADLGNHLRHAYHRTDAEALWSIYEKDLDGLESAVDAILMAHDAGSDE